MSNEDMNPKKTGNSATARTTRAGDLPDSPHDEERMQPEEVILDLPEVKDIPGQENIVPPQMESFADTTIASDDEEGVGILDDEEEDADLIMGTDADVSEEERQTLQRADEDMPTEDDNRLRASSLDNKDFDGDSLNEAGMGQDVSGGDLDTSGVDADDAMEAIGEEDEENNTYSLGGDNNDNITEGTP